MASHRPFNPQFGSNARGTLAAAGTAVVNVPRDNMAVRVVNSGAGDLYFAAYDSRNSYTPSNKDYAVRPGMASLVYIGPADRIGLYSLAGTDYDVISGSGGV